MKVRLLTVPIVLDKERINEMINSKRDLADMTVAAGEKWIGSMSNADLNALFSLNTEK